MTDATDSIRAGYDAVARAYADRFVSELHHKPLDRALLAWFAGLVAGQGPVADVGCGPGQITRHLHELGADVFGVDLSPRMVEVARDLHKDRGVAFRQGDLGALDLADSSLAGAVAFYAHVHVPEAGLARAFAELRRVLRPGAPALLAFHVGREVLHVESFLGHAVDLDFHLFPMAAVLGALREAGLEPDMHLERAPYVPHEHPSTRGYVLARRRP